MSAKPWDPTEVVDAAMARHLIDDQFPDLAGEPLTYVGAGWDNTAWRVGDWVFRFPRRGIARALIQTEITALAGLADALPLPISAPQRVGQPDDGYPYPWAGYRWLVGDTGCRAAIDQDAAAPILGDFLRALHAQDAPVPVDEWRFDIPAQATRLHALLDQTSNEVVPALHAVREAVHTLVSTPLYTHPPVLCHGDLYARHVLFADGIPSGIIDWGDVHLGDRATDLAVAWMLFDGPARERLLDAYGGATPPIRNRARFRALYSGVHQAVYGHDVHDVPMYQAGLAAIERAVSAA